MTQAKPSLTTEALQGSATRIACLLACLLACLIILRKTQLSKQNRLCVWGAQTMCAVWLSGVWTLSFHPANCESALASCPRAACDMPVVCLRFQSQPSFVVEPMLKKRIFKIISDTATSACDCRIQTGQTCTQKVGLA